MISYITNRNIRVYNADNQISHNSDYIAKFIFDDEWNGKIKTARFIQDNEHFDVILVNDKCKIPPLKNGHIKIGVFTDSMTSTYADVYFKTSVKDGIDTLEPPEGVYEQLITLIESGMLKGEDGLTPYVGLNNNWWIGDIDTGVLARGTDGEDGYTPVKGVDYFTEEEIQQIQNEVSSGAIGDFKAVVDEETATFNTNAENTLTDYNANAQEKFDTYNTNADSKFETYNTNAETKFSVYNTNAEVKLSEYNQNDLDKTTLYNTNADSKFTTYNENAETKFSEYTSNADTKLSEYNQNDSDKTALYNANAESKLDAYDSNAQAKLDLYNQNDSEKLEAYNSNHTEKMTAYDTNATDKLSTYNSNAEQKLEAYNSNHTAKVAEYNQNADNRVAEFDSHTEQIQTDINGLKSDLTDITDTETKTETHNIEQSVIKTSNYYYWKGQPSSNTEYFYVHIDNLQEGDIITAIAGNRYQPMRFIDAYNGTSRVSSASNSSEVRSYTVPVGVDNVYISCYIRYVDEMQFYIQRTVTIRTITLKGFNALSERVTSLENVVIDSEKNIITASASTLSANDALICAERIDNKKNCSYIVWANFDIFDTLTVAHGYTSFGDSYIVVDNSDIVAYYYNGSQPVEMGRYAHGLIISDFVQVNIKVGNTNNLRAVVSVMTSTGMFTQSNVPFGGCNGDIFMSATMLMTNVKMQYILDDMKTDVYLFGDSYTSLGDPNRYPYQLMEQGYNDFLISGYSGASSSGEIVSFRNILAVHTPKYLIWALGMNDADNESTYNVSWKTCLDEVIATCKEKGIELILATIPNTPSISNYYKNDFVRNSGYRYIDFAKAVGADEIGSTWYENMLSSDKVHPALLGAKALASRFLIDVPEVIV